MMTVVSLSLSLLVVLAALALLAKTKKDELAKGYVFASYTVLFLGILMFLGSVMGGVMRNLHHRGYNSCCVSQDAGQCGYINRCGSAKMCKSSKGFHHGQHMSCGSTCSMGGHHSKCQSWKDGAKHKRICIKKHGDKKEVKTEMKFSDDDDDDTHEHNEENEQ